jgi:DNA-binding MarR family transcriptional regulator
MAHSRRPAGAQVAFLLAQVGASSSRRFAEALEKLEFAPWGAGILRLLSRMPGISQQELAARLDTHASRLVGMIDALEKRGLVVREPNPEDRRLYRLRLTEPGEEMLAEIGKVAQAHNREVCAGLDEDEIQQLCILLEKLAGLHGLTPEVHPGYREIGALEARKLRRDAK